MFLLDVYLFPEEAFMRTLVALIALVGASISPLPAQDLVYYFPHIAD